jgi:hypothetical protein
MSRGGQGWRGGRVRREKGSRPKKEEEAEEHEPWNEEELAWMAGDAGGWPAPYVPKTDLEQLLGKGLTVMGSAKGVLESAMYRVQVATNNINAPHRHADGHLVRMSEGNGTFFESPSAKAVSQEYFNDKRERIADTLGKEFQPLEIPMLPETERIKLSEAWIGGQYVGPKPVVAGDILRHVEAYAKRNETYLPGDSRKVQYRLELLLPASA